MNAYTTLWTADQVRRVKSAGLVGQRIPMTFGGPHQSAPSFRRAGVCPGDQVMPVQVRDGRLIILCRLQVAEILSAEEFVGRHPEWFDAILDQSEFRRLAPHLDTGESRAFWQLRLWLERHPEFDAMCPGEANEVLVAAESSPILVDRVVPAYIVSALRWQSPRRPERAIKHLSADGRAERSISSQGIYRLTANSSAQLLTLAGE